MSVTQELAKQLMRHKARLFFGILCMLLFALFTVAPAKFIKDIIDALGSGKVPALSQFIYVGGGLILLYFFKGFTFFGQSYLMSSLGLVMIRELRARLFNKIIGMPLVFFNKTKAGNLISNFTTDLNLLNEAVTLTISGPMRDIPQIALLFWLMYDRSWKLFVITVILIPIAGLVIQKFGRQNKKVTRRRLRRYGDLTNLLNEVVQGIRIVKAFSMEGYELSRFKKENQRLYTSLMHSVRIDSYSYPILELMGGCFAAVILTYGGYLVIHQEMTGGDFASFIMSFFMLYDPIKKFNGFNLKVQEGLAAGQRIFSILNSELKICDQPGAKPLPPLSKEIHIHIKRFCYDQVEVLKDIDIQVTKGQVIALVGSSGSGKSTLVNLIPRFYDIPAEDGFIRIDGHDIQEVTLESLRSQIAVVTQEVVLFNDTVHSNISYGNPKSTENSVQNAAKAGYAHGFITKLPHQYQEEVGEQGAALSGGQRQRISISRALIKDAGILILDEATSALDNESEQEVQKAIANLMKNRTTLVIAHRLSTILNADQIYVMKEGRIVQKGTHQELLAQEGEYKRLYDLQFQEAV